MLVDFDRCMLRQLLETTNTLLKMPAVLERILDKFETGQFVIIWVEVSASAPQPSAGVKGIALRQPSLSLALMFIGCLGLAAFFLYDHNQLLAILTMVLAAFLGLRMFLRW